MAGGREVARSVFELRLDPDAPGLFRPVWVAEYVAGRRRRSVAFDAAREAHVALLRDGVGCLRAALAAAAEAVDAAREAWTVRRRAAAQRRAEEQSARARREISQLDGDSGDEEADGGLAAGAGPDAPATAASAGMAGTRRGTGRSAGAQRHEAAMGLRVERVRLDTGAMADGTGGRGWGWTVEVDAGGGLAGRWTAEDGDVAGDENGAGWLIWGRGVEARVGGGWAGDVVLRVTAEARAGGDADEAREAESGEEAADGAGRESQTCGPGPGPAPQGDVVAGSVGSWVLGQQVGGVGDAVAGADEAPVASRGATGGSGGGRAGERRRWTWEARSSRTHTRTTPRAHTHTGTRIHAPRRAHTRTTPRAYTHTGARKPLLALRNAGALPPPSETAGEEGARGGRGQGSAPVFACAGL
jgi:hypothetical protein